jgi:hypothetical protein
MVANGIRFFTAVFWNLFTVVVETCRRVLFAWARVDRLACWLSVAMLILALFAESSLCLWAATGSIVCLSIAAWRGEKWDLKNDVLIGSRRFQQGWERDAGRPASFTARPFQRRGGPRTTFASSIRRRETAADALK